LKDISDVEFSFICAESSGEQVEHIFERGALTKSDHWDTAVQCKKCLEPTMHHVLMKKAHDEEKDAEEETDSAKDSEKEKEEEKDSEKEEEKDSEKEEDKDAEKDSEKEEDKEGEKATEEEKAKEEEAKKEAEAKAVDDLKDTAVKMVAVPPSYAAFYGPGGCVTTYKGPAGTCIMETSCEGESMANYTYGLMCDKGGERVRHVFMGDAFEPVESFDTLIECDLCLGLDTAGSVGIGQEVGELKDEVKVLAEKVEKLEKASAPAETETAEAAETGTAETDTADAPAASLLLHKSKKMSTYKAKDAPAAEKAEVEVDVVHHNRETKFLKSSKGVTLSSHTDWDPVSARLNQPSLKRGKHPAPSARRLKNLK
jgi:phage-related minor tail protein